EACPLQAVSQAALLGGSPPKNSKENALGSLGPLGLFNTFRSSIANLERGLLQSWSKPRSKLQKRLPDGCYMQRGPTLVTLQVLPAVHVRMRPPPQQGCPMSPQSSQVPMMPLPMVPVAVQPRFV